MSSTEHVCLQSLLYMYGISKEISQELLLLIFLIKSARNQKGNIPGAPQRTSAYIPCQKCMESVMTQTRSSTEDFCSYSSLEVYAISKEIDQELQKGLLLIFLNKHVWNQQGHIPGAPQMTSAHIPYFSKEIDQELYRGLLLTFLIKSVRHQWGNRPGAPQRTSAYTPY